MMIYTEVTIPTSGSSEPIVYRAELEYARELVVLYRTVGTEKKCLGSGIWEKGEVKMTYYLSNTPWFKTTPENYREMLRRALSAALQVTIMEGNEEVHRLLRIRLHIAEPPQPVTP